MIVGVLIWHGGSCKQQTTPRCIPHPFDGRRQPGHCFPPPSPPPLSLFSWPTSAQHHDESHSTNVYGVHPATFPCYYCIVGSPEL